MRFRASKAGFFVTLAAGIALSGCSNVDWDSPQAWFAKPLDVSGRTGGYTFSELQDSKQRQKPVTPNDLVSASGACAPVQAAQSAVSGPGVQPTALAATDADGSLGTGVALGMTECDVVARAGTPNSVQIGRTSAGDRTALLTYSGGPRPGTYHFERGTLTEMDRTAAPPAPEPAPKVVKKKSTKSKQASTQ